jgi:hypothetical protein
MTRVFRVKDWRMPDASELTPDQAKSRLVSIQTDGGNQLWLEIERIGGKGQNHEIALELDKGFVRVRAYAPGRNQDEPIAEMWLGDEAGYYEKPF